MLCLWFECKGLEFGVWGWGLEFRVSELEVWFRVEGLGLTNWD